MSEDRLQRVQELLQAARRFDRGARAAFLDSTCGGDRALRQEVESLLDREAGEPAPGAAQDLGGSDPPGAEPRRLTGRFGPYEILSFVGAGGMGEVYRALDTRLDRQVAIKVLPSRVAEDPTRLKRFQLEAKAASALSHPNVAHIYEIGEAEGVPFIVMEYVEGQTLASRISGRQMKESEILEIARQVADALDEAHAKGFIHRDIKPANIILTPRGQVKVLDFGVVKRIHSTGTTRSLLSTQAGQAVGTVTYMSPEQLLGEDVDPRSDLFSLGVVLYEMATGCLPFSGPSTAAVMDRILHHEPAAISRLNYHLSAEIERMIRKAMEKEPERRYQSARELLVDIRNLQRDISSGAATLTGTRLSSRQRPRRRARAWAAAAIVLLLGAIAYLGWRGGWWTRNRAPDASRLTLLVSSLNQVEEPTVSPDGKMIVYVAEEDGRPDLFVARVAGGARLRLTNDAAHEGNPAFSPDGERISFTRISPASPSPEIVAVPTMGGPAVPLIRDAVDATWSPDGSKLVFIRWEAGGARSLALADATGANSRILLRGDAAYTTLRNPAWSPDGSTIAVIRSSGGVSGETWLVPVKGGPPHQLTRDAPGVFSDEPVFTPDGRGVIEISNRAGTTNLWLVSLDGSPATRLTTGPGPDSSPSIAASGVIVFLHKRSRSALLLHDPKTRQSREILSHSAYLWAPAFSPNGRDLAFSRFEPNGLWHIWIVPAHGGEARQLTAGRVPEIYPRFAPDGQSIFFQTWGPGPDRIWRVPVGGGAPVAITPPRDGDDAYADVSPDGRQLAFARTEKDVTRIWTIPVAGGEAKRLVDSPSTLPRWSPDGRWIAFTPSRTLSAGVFVVSAAGAALRRLTERGSWPVWWPDGKRIAYLVAGPEGHQSVLTVPFAGGTSEPLSSPKFEGTNYPIDVSPDGSHIATSNAVLLAADIWMLEPR